MEKGLQLLKKVFCNEEKKTIKIDAAVFSNPGNIRNNHEDNYLLGRGQYISENQQRAMINSYVTSCCAYKGEEGVFAVCDGMGGHMSGERASSMAVQCLDRAYDALLTSDEKQIGSCVSMMNEEICSYAKTHLECRNMGSTLAGFLVTNQGLYCFHAGDSRIYMFSGGHMIRLTTDHTEGQRLLDLNRLTAQELEEFKKRKHLYRYLGYPGVLVPDVKKLEMAEGTYLLCSDGVSDLLEDSVLEKILDENSGSAAIGEKILQRALEMNERCTDNVTVMVVHIAFERKKVRF